MASPSLDAKLPSSSAVLPDSPSDKNSRPTSPGQSGKGKRPSVAAKKKAAFPAADEGTSSAPLTLGDAIDKLDQKDKDISLLQQKLLESTTKQEDLFRLGAKRMIQIALLEDQLEKERTKTKEMAEQLEKQSQMMDLVINFRDQECARDVNELTHENLTLAGQVEVWKERAQGLQQERWGFVQKFRAAKSQAASGGGTGGFDKMGEHDDDDDDDDDDDGEKDGSDDDW